MRKLKKWYNKMLVNKYDGKNIDLLEMLGEKRPFLFCLPLYSPSLYFKYKADIITKAFMEGYKSEMKKFAETLQNEMPKAFEQASTSTEELSKEIHKSFGTKIDQVFIDDIWGIKKKGGKK